MSESHEQLHSKIESGIEASEAASKQLDKLSNAPEKSAEVAPRDSETRAEKARKDALEKAVSIESGGKEKDKRSAPYSGPVRRGAISKKQLDKSYRQTIGQVQSELPLANRAFSKVIHSRYIEKTSEIVGGTIARPNAILYGGIMAFALTLIVYITAKKIGYELSGFETIAAFIVGWLIGIVFDYFKLLFTGKKF